jgi:hypothetical protein
MISQIVKYLSLHLVQKHIKIYISIILLIFFLLSPCSCKKEPPCVCGVELPETNLIWLKNNLSLRFCAEVYSFSYESIEYIIICDCPEASDILEVFFDCQGNKVCELGGANAGGDNCSLPNGFPFEDYKHNRKLIYKQP